MVTYPSQNPKKGTSSIARFILFGWKNSSPISTPTQPPSPHRQVLHPKIPRWLGPNLIQLAEIWIFGGNIFFWQKNEDLTSSTSFLGGKQEFLVEKKHGNLYPSFFKVIKIRSPKRRSLCFSPEKVTKMGTETRSL